MSNYRHTTEGYDDVFAAPRNDNGPEVTDGTILIQAQTLYEREYLINQEYERWEQHPNAAIKSGALALVEQRYIDWTEDETRLMRRVRARYGLDAWKRLQANSRRAAAAIHNPS